MKTENRLSAFYVRHEYAVVLGLILSWQISLISVSNGLFLDTDSYTHALRLMDFIQSGSWKEILYRHDNCPFGQILHFTRITDMFLYLTTLPFMPFMELKHAIMFGGFLYNPVIACLSAAALIWAGKAFCSPVIRLTGILAYFFILPEISFLFLAGRPDHHVLLNLFLILLSGCLAYGVKTQKTAYYKTAGLFGGLAVWTSPEGMLACFFLFAGMVAAWLVKCQNIRQIRLFSQFLFVTTTLCLLINPPMQGLFHPDNGRLSILMATLFGFTFLSFRAQEFFERNRYIHSFFGRFFSLSALTFFSFGFALLLFDGDVFFSSPISPEIFDIWASGIKEFLPADFKTIRPLLFAFVISLPAFFLATVHLRKLLLINGIPLLLFTLLALISIRFCRLASIYATFVMIFSVQIFFNKFSFSVFRITSLLWLVLTTGLVIPHLFTLYKTQFFEQKILTPYQETVPYLSKKKGCVLTLNNEGPQTAWEIGEAVIGSPYHTNVDGIIDNYILFNSTDITSIQKLLKKRNISTIIFHNPEYIIEKHTGSKNYPYAFQKAVLVEQLLSTDNDLCFLKAVNDIPQKIKEKYFIYHVDFNDCD